MGLWSAIELLMQKMNAVELELGHTSVFRKIRSVSVI